MSPVALDDVNSQIVVAVRVVDQVPRQDFATERARDKNGGMARMKGN